MKFNIKYILLFVAIYSISLFSNNNAIAKETTDRDTIATIALSDVKLISSTELSFKIRLIRHSDKWFSFANGTYQIVFDVPGIDINSDSMDIVFTGNTDLKLYVSPGGGNELPTDAYIIRPTINNQNKRISIFIAGPETFADAKYVPINDSGIVLGEFTVRGKNNFLMPDRLRWLEPVQFYQACAFKLDHDSLLAPGVVYQYTDANLELNDTLKHFIVYQNNTDEKFILDYFRVTYEGQKVVNIDWKTSSEPFNAGFILKRGIRTDQYMSPDLVNYTDTIASYPPDILYKGTGKNGIGGLYFKQDTVQFRNVDYCYQLEYVKRKFEVDSVKLLARQCINIPNAVIFSATSAPNPFTEYTNINFWLEDDSYVTAVVRDIRGREIRTLCKDVPYKFNMRQDPHVLRYEAGADDATGMYEIVIMAIPIKDQSIKIIRILLF